MTRVYRLQVAYPEGSHDEHGQPVPGWEPTGWHPGAYDPTEGPEPFHWPRVHLYLSPGGASRRAAQLREWGATVEVEASNPVEWPGETTGGSS